MMVVKINQPCEDIVSGMNSCALSILWKEKDARTYHQEKTHGVIELGRITAGLAESITNLEPTGGQDDSERDPKTTVGGESSSTKSVADSHFPIKKKARISRRTL